MHTLIELFQQLPNWVNQHQHWFALAAFFIAFCESLAIIGLFIPGSSSLIAIGFFIGGGHLPLWPVILMTILGSFAGDLISFAIGRRYQQSIRRRWPFKHFTTLFNQGDQFFQKYGGKSVFFGRFIRPLHPTIPLIAGMMKLEWRPFLIADLASAMIWSPACFIPGLFVGYGLIDLPAKQAEGLLMGLLFGLLCFFGIYWLIRKIYLHIHRRIFKRLQQVWHTLSSPFLHNLLRDAERPNDTRQLSLAIWTMLCLMLLFMLFILVRLQLGISYINTTSHLGLLDIRNQLLLDIMTIISFIGQKTILIPTVLAVVLYAVWHKQWRLALHWLGLLLACALMIIVFKQLSHSPRPSDIVAVPSGFSFPSGHVVLSIAIWGFLAYLVREHMPKTIQHWPINIVSLLTILVIFSRLYLGVHWLTDTLGGIFLGLTCLFITIISYRRQKTSRIAIDQLLPLMLLVFLVIGSIYGWKYYQQHMHDYQITHSADLFEPTIVVE